MLIIYYKKIEIKNELKKNDIKSRTCYYIDDIIKTEDFDLQNILVDKKLYENISVYNVSCKSLIDSKPLHIRFNKIDGFIRVYDGTRYLVLFASEKCDYIFNRIRYIINIKKVLQIEFLIIMQKSKLIHSILYL